MQEVSAVGSKYDALAWALSEADHNHEHYHFWRDALVQLAASSSGVWTEGHVCNVQSDGALEIRDPTGTHHLVRAHDVSAKLKHGKATQLSQPILAREDVKLAGETVLELELFIYDAYIRSFKSSTKRRVLKRREIGPKIKDYQAGYNWVHDVVIKAKKREDSSIHYGKVMDQAAALQAEPLPCFRSLACRRHDNWSWTETAPARIQFF